jgi:hypothetical protein
LQDELEKVYEWFGVTPPVPSVAGPSRSRAAMGGTTLPPTDQPVRASSQLPHGSHLHRILTDEKKHEARTTIVSVPSTSGSSDSESHSLSSSPNTGNDWSSLSSEPSDPDSDMSARSKRRKRAQKRSWKKKMLKLRLEQANGKPDPPFVYNGEPNFTLYQKWVLEAKDWLKLSFIQRKHRVARLKKYLAGRTFHFFMRGRRT